MMSVAHFSSTHRCRGGGCFRLAQGASGREWKTLAGEFDPRSTIFWNLGLTIGQNHLIRTKKTAKHFPRHDLWDALSLKKLFLSGWVAGHIVWGCSIPGLVLSGGFLDGVMDDSHPNKMDRNSWLLMNQPFMSSPFLHKSAFK